MSPTPVRGTTRRARQYFRRGMQPAREGTPEPTKGMVVVRGQEGMDQDY